MNVGSARGRGARTSAAAPAVGSAILIIGFGNPLHGDAAVGWRVAELLPAAHAGARVVACPALVPELAPAKAAAELVIFVGPCEVGTVGEVRCIRIEPVRGPAPPPSGETPASLLTRASARFQRPPATYLITIAVGELANGVPLSPAVADAVSQAVRHIEAFAAQVAAR